MRARSSNASTACLIASSSSSGSAKRSPGILRLPDLGSQQGPRSPTTEPRRFLDRTRFKHLSTRMRYALALAFVSLLAGCGGSTRTIIRTVAPSSAPATQAPTGTTGTTATVPGEYTGNGTENLGTIHIPHSGLIEWQCSCPAFALISGLSGTQTIAISSTTSTGQSAVDAGSYPDVRVLTTGDWTIVFPQ